jgi:iron complex outermembrane receptor protein
MLDEYFVNGFNAIYTIKPKIFEEIGFNLALNNIFSAKYETNAWVYPYLQNNQYYEYNGYFPQALLNLLIGITIKM